MNSHGSVDCDVPAQLSIETCLQLQPIGGGAFGEPGTCMSSSNGPERTLSLNVEVGCLGTRTYRTVVSASVNGTALPTKISAESSPPCN